MMYRKAYEWGKTRLEMAGINEAGLDARILLEYVCHTTRNDLHANSERELTPEEYERYETLVLKRSTRIPLQHPTQSQEFMGLDFYVNDKVLIPRQDTEILAEEGIIATEDGDRILDLCTGSGCVLLSVMRYKNDVVGVGTDISEEALGVARHNYETFRDQINGTAQFIQSDLYESSELTGHFDVILSNPPYIRTAVIETLQEEVRDHDPYIALDGGDDGLEFYRRIAAGASDYLKPEGKLILEIGYDQAEDVVAICEEHGFTELKVIKDLSGNDRVVKGKKYV